MHSDSERQQRRGNPSWPWIKLTPLAYYSEIAATLWHSVEENCHSSCGPIGWLHRLHSEVICLLPVPLKRWLLNVGSFLFQRPAAVVSINLCHLQYTPKVTCFMAEIQYRNVHGSFSNYSYKSCNIIHFPAVHQYAQYAEHTASVSSLLILCVACAVSWLHLDIFCHFFLADQFYISQLARWIAAV